MRIFEKSRFISSAYVLCRVCKTPESNMSLKKNTLSYCRPTGRLDPTPADLAYGSVDLAALEYRARRGEIILLYEDETILWRFALPRLGWWRTAQRARLPTRPLSQSQIKREESLKRQAWRGHRGYPLSPGQPAFSMTCHEGLTTLPGHGQLVDL